MNQFGQNYKWIKSVCKACDNNRMKSRIRTKETSTEQALHLLQAISLAELWFLDILGKIEFSTGRLPDRSELTRRWEVNTELAGYSICHFYALPEEAKEEWPMKYRQLVLEATKRKNELNIRKYGLEYELVNTSPLPSPTDTHEHIKACVKAFLDPTNVAVCLR